MHVWDKMLSDWKLHGRKNSSTWLTILLQWKNRKPCLNWMSQTIALFLKWARCHLKDWAQIMHTISDLSYGDVSLPLQAEPISRITQHRITASHGFLKNIIYLRHVFNTSTDANNMFTAIFFKLEFLTQERKRKKLLSNIHFPNKHKIYMVLWFLELLDSCRIP